MDIKRVTLPLDDETILSLKTGETVLLSGRVYTGRDAAHKRMVSAIEKGDSLPFDLRGESIYYVGPAPAREGQAVGAAGPTTSYRMDAYAPALLERGLKGMIGKGDRSEVVIEAIKKYRCVYFAAVGGAAALISKHILSSRVIAYDDLGTEAVHEFEISDFPAIVAIDCLGNDLYKDGPTRFFVNKA